MSDTGRKKMTAHARNENLELGDASVEEPYRCEGSEGHGGLEVSYTVISYISSRTSREYSRLQLKNSSP